MAKKKLKAQATIEEMIAAPEPPKEREAQEEVIPDSTDTKSTDYTDVWGGILGTQTSSDPPPQTTVSQPVLESNSVDEYIRKQVIREMYGTDNPSPYEITQQAIKRLL